MPPPWGPDHLPFSPFCIIAEKKCRQKEFRIPVSACTRHLVFVSVPVLSEQTTLTAQASPPTAASVRSCLLLPSWRLRCENDRDDRREVLPGPPPPPGGSPSGNISPHPASGRSPSKIKQRRVPPPGCLTPFRGLPNRFCSGVISSGVSWISFAIHRSPSPFPSL